jgi:hypothetical protein
MLLDGAGGPGTQEVVWDGKDASGHAVAAGVYFYALDTGRETIRMKSVVLR